MRGFILSLLLILSLDCFAQPNLRDSLDHKLDMSDWVLEAHGFIPVPMLITEPALGDIGGALFPVFIAKNEPLIDSVDGKRIVERVRPDIYGVGAAYTANNTWLVAALASGAVREWRSKYRIAAAYADVNLEFYRDLPDNTTHSFLFNIETVPVNAQFIKQIKKRSNWYAGIDYLYLHSKLTRPNAEFHAPDDIESTVSRAGLLVDFDARDNIFTPDKGIRWNTVISASDKTIGSDYNYQQAASAVFAYTPFTEKLIAAVRLDYQQVWGDVPFYLLPFINLRGIPVARYQGEVVSLTEAELRYDFSLRWSGIVFGGAGKAFNDWAAFNDSDWQEAGGAGFRYLIARKLKLRMGLDVARGPEDFAWYMVFGTSWVK